MEWMPIKTAPKKDAHHVLCIVAGYLPSIAYWSDEYQKWMNVEPEDFCCDECWEKAADGNYEPTHWMPLPLPPNAELERIFEEIDMRDTRTWALENHLCKACGGRILRCVKGNGITGGGNPVFKCADCGKAVAAMGPEELCWCGFSHRGNRDNAYTCQPFSVLKDRPELLSAFRACGCDPERGEVGIMLERDLRTNERGQGPAACSRSPGPTGYTSGTTERK